MSAVKQDPAAEKPVVSAVKQEPVITASAALAVIGGGPSTITLTGTSTPSAP